MTTYIELPQEGNPYFQNPVESVGDLPLTDLAGTVRLVEDDNVLYWFDGSSWTAVGSAVGGVDDTNSIDLTVTSGTLTADLNLSAAVADPNFQLVALSIETDGLLAQIADSSIRGRISASAPLAYNSSTGDLTITQADTDTDGYLSDTDWNTFNDKQDDIVATTAADYYRGDKTFQLLEMSALTAVTGGGSASAGAIGEILTASQSSDTAAAATGDWGPVTSVSLTAGVWHVTGVTAFNFNGADMTTSLSTAISSSSSGAGLSELDTSVLCALSNDAADNLIPTPGIYISISSTTTYYLLARAFYTAGSPQVRGKITAIRIR